MPGTNQNIVKKLKTLTYHHVLKYNAMSRHKVTIIGAGAAGLAATVRLSALNIEDVLILEASEARVGGRVWSKRLREEGPTVEMGAQWIHGQEGNLVHDLASKLGFLEKPEETRGVEGHCEHEALSVMDGHPVSPEMIRTLTMAMSRVEESVETIPEDSWSQYPSMRDYVDQTADTVLASCDRLDPDVKRAYLHWWGKLQACIDGAPDMEDTAVYQNIVYRECPGNQTVNIDKRMSYQALLERYAERVISKVKMGQTVVKISYSDEKVRLQTHDGAEYVSDICIVTLPLGVLKKDHHTLFDPPLPDWKKTAIEKMGFGTVVKIFIQFDVELSSLEGFVTEGFNFLRRDPSYTSWTDSVFGLYPDHAEDRVLVAWMSGPGAVTVEEMEEAEVMAGVRRLLEQFIIPCMPLLPAPVRCHVTSWGSSSVSRGSYSYLTPASPPDTPQVLARPLAGGRVLVAGEATHQTYFGTVHGALETGIREAERAAKRLGSNTESD